MTGWPELCRSGRLWPELDTCRVIPYTWIVPSRSMDASFSKLIIYIVFVFFPLEPGSFIRPLSSVHLLVVLFVHLLVASLVPKHQTTNPSHPPISSHLSHKTPQGGFISQGGQILETAAVTKTHRWLFQRLDSRMITHTGRVKGWLIHNIYIYILYI